MDNENTQDNDKCDIRTLRESIDKGEIDFSGLEMA